MSSKSTITLTPGCFQSGLAVPGLLVLIQLRILRYAYMRSRRSWRRPCAAVGSLIGSYFNIPITVLSGRP